MEPTDCDEPRDLVHHCEQLFTLVSTFSLDFSWLEDVFELLTARSNWNDEWRSEPYERLRSGQAGWNTALAEGTAVVMGRQVRSRSEVAHDLERILGRHPEDDRLDGLRYFWAQALRDSGQFQRSATVMRGLLGGSRDGSARQGLFHLLRREGRLEDAGIALADEEFVNRRKTRLSAELLWSEGRVGLAAAQFERAGREALEAGDEGEIALCLAGEAWCAALGGDAVTCASHVAEADTVLRSKYQSFAHLLCRLAQGLTAAASQSDFEPLHEVELAARRIGQSSIVAYARFSACLATPSTGRIETVSERIAHLSRSVHGREFSHLMAIAQTAHGVDSTVEHSLNESTLRRWVDLQNRLTSKGI